MQQSVRSGLRNARSACHNRAIVTRTRLKGTPCNRPQPKPQKRANMSNSRRQNRPLFGSGGNTHANLKSMSFTLLMILIKSHIKRGILQCLLVSRFKGVIMQTVYIIRSINTRKMIECHDSISLEWAQNTVKTHNMLFPLDQWVIVEEVL